MSGSQYWTSLWGVGLIIFLFFFILFLGLAFFTFLYDRISVFEIWNSPVWLKTKAPLIIICVIGFLAALITYIRYEGRKELRARLKLKGGEDKVLRAWEWRYYNNLLKKTKYSIDHEKIKEYFPLETVIKGMFEVFGEVLGVSSVLLLAILPIESAICCSILAKSPMPVFSSPAHLQNRRRSKKVLKYGLRQQGVFPARR